LSHFAKIPQIYFKSGLGKYINVFFEGIKQKSFRGSHSSPFGWAGLLIPQT